LLGEWWIAAWFLFIFLVLLPKLRLVCFVFGSEVACFTCIIGTGVLSYWVKQTLQMT